MATKPAGKTLRPILYDPLKTNLIEKEFASGRNFSHRDWYRAVADNPG